jgi:type I restriction enzyme S subunit
MSPLPAIDIRPEQWAIVESILKHHVPAYEVWAFGSRAKKSAKPYSDLDLCVLSAQPLGLRLHAELTEAFAESDLPWKVDVVDWATTSETFRQIIAANKVVLQKSSSGIESPGDCDVSGSMP